MWFVAVFLTSSIIIRPCLSQLSQPTTAEYNAVSNSHIQQVSILRNADAILCPPCVNNFNKAVLEQITQFKRRLESTGSLIREMRQLKYDIRLSINKSEPDRLRVEKYRKLVVFDCF